MQVNQQLIEKVAKNARIELTEDIAKRAGQLFRDTKKIFQIFYIWYLNNIPISF